MSGTDVHRPPWVQMADPHDRHHWRRSPGTPAHPSIPWCLRNLCGCRLCTAHDSFRDDRRRDRHQAKQQIRRGNHAE